MRGRRYRAADWPDAARGAAVGRFTDEFGRGWPRLQFLTLAELFQGKRPAIRFVDPPVALRRARREETERQGNPHALYIGHEALLYPRLAQR